MELYLVRGSFYHSYRENDETTYREAIHTYQVEEKPKSYVGKHMRVNKTEIGSLRPSFSGESYEMYVTSESDIPEARRLVKAEVMKNVADKLNRYRDLFNALEKHDLDSPVPGYVK